MPNHTANPLDPRRSRGRPLGSKNKSKVPLTPSKNRPTAFTKGWKGGPGRPEGSRNKVSLLIEEMGMKDALRAYEHLAAMALGEKDKGDIAGCRYIVEKLCPPRKGYRLNPDLLGDIKNIETVADVSLASVKITSMMLEGVLSAEEAKGYCEVLDHRLKIITDMDILKKIEETCTKVDSLYTDK